MDSAGQWIAPAPTNGIPASGADDKVDRILKDYDTAIQTRTVWLPMWQDCYDYALPSRGDGFYTTTPGRRRTDKIFDETGVVSVQEFASRMQAGLVPNYTKWASLEAGSEIPEDKRKEADVQLEAVTEYVFDVLYNSNFPQEAHECFLDLSLGTAAMIVEEGNIDHPIKFTAIPLTQLILSAGPFDAIDKVFRRRMMKAEDILHTWPKAASVEKFATDARKDPRKMFEVVEATYRDWENKGDEVWLFDVILKEYKECLFEGKFKGEGSNPWVVFRWSKCSGEVYGRGPLLNALPAIKTANLTVELILENAQMAISGMWQVEDDGVVNVANIQLIPGSIVPTAQGSKGLQPLKPGSDFNVGELVLNDMRQNIKKALYDEMLGPMDKTPMSAAEVHARMADMARRVGSAYGRLQYEFVQPVIKRVVHILRKQGRIHLPTVNGREVRVTATSPLARSQNYEDVNAVDRWLEVLGVRFGPQMVNMIAKGEEAGAWLATKLGVPSELVRNAAERQQLAKQMGQMANQAVASGADPKDIIKQAMP